MSLVCSEDGAFVDQLWASQCLRGRNAAKLVSQPVRKMEVGGTSTTGRLGTKSLKKQFSGSLVGLNLLCTLDRHDFYPLLGVHSRMDTAIGLLCSTDHSL